jgi:Tol biopolymer transport system component
VAPDAGSLATSLPFGNQKPLWIFGGVGCLVLLCAVVLIGGIFTARRLQSDNAQPEIAADTGSGTLVESVSSTATDSSTELPETADDNPSSAAPAAQAETVETVTGSPEMGAITFAQETTSTGEPVEPAFSFETGVTQVHAVFEFANMTPKQSWTQVWYYNGNELYRTSQPWLADQNGSFDYPITANGEALPEGQWTLEFYVGDELLTAGSFSIEPAESEETTETAAPFDPAEVSKVYQLVYTKWNGEKHDLYVGDTNGSFEKYLLGRVAGPSWSQDGRYLFFYGEEGIDNQVINGKSYPLPGATNGLVRINAAPLPSGLGQVQIYQGYGWNDGSARSANISPDGTMIAYDGDRGGGRRIYFLGTAANQQYRYEIIGEQADWSPDSKKIVYRSGRNNQTGLWISNREDSGHTRITSGGSDSFPSWSPDGELIAFSREVGGNVEIFTVKPDGSELRQVTTSPGHDTLPLFLPTGEIVFRSARDGRWGIWKMKADGTDQTLIIANAPVGPDWAYSKMDVLP